MDSFCCDWLVWSNEHEGFWKGNNLGYTRKYHEAGRFTMNEAISIYTSQNSDLSSDKVKNTVVFRICGSLP